MTARRARVVLAVGLLAYITAVMQRSTLGVAGVAAAERFETSAAALSALGVLQLVVYAGLQIPVGVLLDRVGAKNLMLTGTVLMTVGQTVLAVSTVIPVAVLGRVLVGAGDAMIFISLIRLINSWFSGRTVPVLSQWVANLGQLGQVLSAIPFAFLLHESGWTPGFLGAAATTALASLLVFVALADRPTDAEAPAARLSWSQAGRQLVAAFRRPGTRLGFWSHYVTQSSGTVFSLMWGFPFLVYGLGYSERAASGFISLLVVSGLVFGPLLGLLSARYPLRRSNLVLGIVSALGIAWAVLLAWPGDPPAWLVGAVIIVIGIGGPGSIIGFDFARTFNPSASLGSANGVVNVGGFLASFVTMFLIGVLLDVQDAARVASGLPSDLYDQTSFRVAFLVQYLVVGVGVVFLVRARRQTRRRLEQEEGIRVGPIWVALIRAWRRRGKGRPGSVQ